MKKTKIDWCDSTWNPVTGCLHDCEYCYARGIARRFGGWHYSSGMVRVNIADDKTFIAHTTDSHRNWDCNVFDYNGAKVADLKAPYRKDRGYTDVSAPYPFGFMPTFHRYRLDIPQSWKEPRNIFVCSMADLFGEWVPDEWIAEVFKACAAAPWHRYLFLTKNPARYIELHNKGILRNGDNYWYGSTVTNPDTNAFWSDTHNVFTSIEPLLKPFDVNTKAFSLTNWVIIGAESGKRKDKVVPKREWIKSIVNDCRRHNVPVFMKDSLAAIWGEPLLRECPWES